MKISFCVQTYNRLWQLRRTVPHNIATLALTGHELIILDCGSGDGTEEYLRNVAGCRYVRHPMPVYHIPAAKNAAHALATGEYVFNLDADNFVTPALIGATCDLPVTWRSAGTDLPYTEGWWPPPNVCRRNNSRRRLSAGLGLRPWPAIQL